MLRLALATLLLAITTVPAKSSEIATSSAAAVGPTTVAVYRNQADHKHITLDGIKAKGNPQVTQAVLQSMAHKLTGETVNTVTCLFTPGDEVKRDLGFGARGRTVRGTGRCWVDGQDLAARLIELGVAEPAQ